MIPEKIAMRLVNDIGFYLVNKIVWFKPNAKPDSTKRRLTCKWEYVFFFTKEYESNFNLDEIKLPVTETTIKRYINAYKFGAMYSEKSKNQTAEEKGINTPKKVPKVFEENIEEKIICKQKTLDGKEIPVTELELKDEAVISRNPGDVWVIPTKRGPRFHFAAFPEDLITPIIKASCPPKGTVLDPFAGSGTVGRVALKHNRNAILIELNKEYINYMKKIFREKCI